jgi:GTP cyclohydrolase I
MEDVQNRPDTRGLPLDKVGVQDIRCPIIVMDRSAQQQHTVATIRMSVSLPHQFKGTHMSRFIEVLNDHRGEVTMRTLPTILRVLRNKLDAERAHIDVEFPYFVERTAPVSGARALMDYRCAFVGEASDHDTDFLLRVEIPVTSLCPCSKDISDYGAHNQRGHITIQLRTVDDDLGRPVLIWIEDLISVAEESGSAPVYPLLKRADERFVTMQAYDNPVFVEDMVRDVAMRLQTDPRVKWFHVSAINQESIHNHNAFAAIEWQRKQTPLALAGVDRSS